MLRRSSSSGALPAHLPIRRSGARRTAIARCAAACLCLVLLWGIICLPVNQRAVHAASPGLTIRIGLIWDRWAVECAGLPDRNVVAQASKRPVWPLTSVASPAATTDATPAAASLAEAAYRVGTAQHATALVAAESKWLVAAARQAATPIGAVSGTVELGVLRRAGPMWYCLVEPARPDAIGTRAGAAEERAADLQEQGWPAFATLWHTPVVAATEPVSYAALPLAGQLSGILLATNLPAMFTPGGGGLPLGHGGRTYRGTLRVDAAGGGNLLAVVNVLDIEDYLLGVVPSEMPAGWPLEALKAQAVAARTYAVANLGKHSSRGFDLCHDVHCQAYLGLGNEYPGPTAAVRATAGVVATYGGRLINAVYHAHSGGATDSSAVIWGSATPYLVGTPRTYEQPYHWTATNTRQEVEAIIRSALDGQVPEGLFPLLAIQPVNYTPGGRAARVNLTGPGATAQIIVSKLRSGLGTYRLREAKFGADGIWVAGLWQAPADAAAFTGLLPVISWAPGARGQGVLVCYEPLAPLADGSDGVGWSTGDSGGVGLAMIDPSFIVFSGQGFGHGVGMSQWGAREMAALGKGYREILTNFYSGISLTANYGR